MPIKIDDSQFIPESGQQAEVKTADQQPLQGEAIFEGGPANPLKAFGVGLMRGASAAGYNPPIRPDEAGWANAGDAVGSIAVNTLPWIAGPFAGTAVNTGYAGARSINEQLAQKGDVNWGQAAGQAGLGLLTSRMPMVFGSRVLPRVVTGTGLGTVTGGAPVLWDQYSETGKVDLSDPRFLMSAGLGSVIGGSIGVASGALPYLYQQFRTNRAEQAGLPSVGSVLDGAGTYAKTGIAPDIIGGRAVIRVPYEIGPSQGGQPIAALPPAPQPAGLLPSVAEGARPTTFLPENPLETLLQGRVELQRTLEGADLSGPPSTPYADEVAQQLAQQDQITQQQLAEWQQRALAEIQGMRAAQDAQQAAQQRGIIDFTRQALRGAGEIRAAQDAQQQQIVDFAQRSLMEAQALRQSGDAAAQAQAEQIENYVRRVISEAQAMREGGATTAPKP